MSFMKTLKSKDAEFAGKLKKVDRSYVTESGKPSKCWEYEGSAFANGYGRVYKKDSPEVKAHRYSYTLTKGKIGKKNGKSLLVLHKCDNRSCCNPNHLYTSDHRRNMEDMIERNRQAKGEANARSTLTENEVAFIKLLVRIGFSYRNIGEILSISKSTASKFGVNSTAWSHVDPMPAKKKKIRAFIRSRRLNIPNVSNIFASNAKKVRLPISWVHQTVKVFGYQQCADWLKTTRKVVIGLMKETEYEYIVIDPLTKEFARSDSSANIREFILKEIGVVYR